MIRAGCRSVIFAFGQATRRTQEHPGSANNKPQVVEAAEAAEAAAEGVEAAEDAAAAVSRGEVAASVKRRTFLLANASLAPAGLFLCRRTRMRRFIPDNSRF